MNLYRIAITDERDKLHADNRTSRGVYKLHCLQINSKTFEPINRVLGSDPEGILYIGRTGVGLSRIGDLVKSLCPSYSSQGHHAGIRYTKNRRLQEQFPFERLCVTFTPSENPAQEEREQIQKYFNQFGEVPPLNANEA